MKKITMIPIFLMSFVSLAQASQVGYVDIQHIVKNSKEGKKILKKLDVFFKQRQKKLNNMAKELERLQKDFAKKEKVISASARVKKIQELSEKGRKYQESIAKSQVELQKKQRELTLPLLKKVEKHVKAMGKKKKYKMILRSEGLLWAEDGTDLTKEILKKL